MEEIIKLMKLFGVKHGYIYLQLHCDLSGSVYFSCTEELAFDFNNYADLCDKLSTWSE